MSCLCVHIKCLECQKGILERWIFAYFFNGKEIIPTWWPLRYGSQIPVLFTEQIMSACDLPSTYSSYKVKVALYCEDFELLQTRKLSSYLGKSLPGPGDRKREAEDGAVCIPQRPSQHSQSSEIWFSLWPLSLQPYYNTYVIYGDSLFIILVQNLAGSGTDKGGGL